MPKAFQKVYTKLVQITKATVALRAENVGNDEMALVRTPSSGCKNDRRYSDSSSLSRN